MSDRHLKLVRDPIPGTCGRPTRSGKPCERPTDGQPCWQHQEGATLGSAAPPAHLGELGRQEWARWIGRPGLADDRGCLAFLELVCELYEMARRCQVLAARIGPVVKDRKNGGVKTNPATAKHLAYRDKFRLAVKDLVARVRLVEEAEEPAEDGLWTDLR